MNFLRNKIIFYILIIFSGIDSTLPWPIFHPKIKTNEQKLLSTNRAETRFKRQIVQPTWLNIGREPSVDPKVQVNPETLFEAEEIRKTIQKAVKENTFVVTAEQQDRNNTMVKFFNTTPPGKSNGVQVINGLPKWYGRMQKLWRFLAQGLFKRFRKERKI